MSLVGADRRAARAANDAARPAVAPYPAKGWTDNHLMGLFQKFRDGLRKTQEKLSSEIKRIVTRAPKLDADALEELEAVLISTDIGISTATKIIELTKEAAMQSGQVDVFAIARSEIERELSFGGSGSSPTAVIDAESGHAGAWPSKLVKAPHPPTVILLA